MDAQNSTLSNTARDRIIRLKIMLEWLRQKRMERKQRGAGIVLISKEIDAMKFTVQELEKVFGAAPVPEDNVEITRIREKIGLYGYKPEWRKD